MKVLLDECVDRRLSRYVTGHEVRTARDMGWGTIKNGELLALAEKEFAVFVTVDRKISFQQDLPGSTSPSWCCARGRTASPIFSLSCRRCSRRYRQRSAASRHLWKSDEKEK